MKYILPLFLLLVACGTKNISVKTPIIMPVRPVPLKNVEVTECQPDYACMTKDGFEKTFIYIDDLEFYADELEILLESVTEEVE